MDLIPKILHTYWDESNMSKLQMFTITTFHKHNPDWKINVYISAQKYNGRARYIPDYRGPDYFQEVKKMPYVNIVTVDLDDYGISHALHGILRSDIFRYHVLYNVGGVWSDFDVIWLKPMEHFNNIEYYGDCSIKEANAVVSFMNGTGGGHSIGIMIHAKHDPYALSLMKATKRVKPPYTHEVFGGDMINHYYPNLKSLASCGNVIGARFETYYPYNIHPPNVTIPRLYSGNYLECINNNVMCVHWYNGRRESKQYVNSNGYARNCSMTTILKNEGCI